MLKPVARFLALLTLAFCCIGEAYPEEADSVGVQFGLNSFLGNLGHSEIHGPLIKPSATDRTNYLGALHDLGISSIRETFLNWADIEPVPGAGYQLQPYDDLAKKAADLGIEIIALAYPFPDWATGAKTTPGPAPGYFSAMPKLPLREHESEFRKVVATVVRRYSGRDPDSVHLGRPIRKWIFSNELDYPNYQVDPDEYAFWLRAFYETVKEADPEALVVTMGISHAANNIGWVNRFLDSPNLKGKGYPYFDVVDFHCYPGIYDPNVYVMDADAGFLQSALRKRGISKPLWLMETGDNSANDNEQASKAIQDLIHGASLPGVTRVNLHGLHDLGGPGESWGVLADSPAGQVPRRKPLFTAYATLLRVIGKNRSVEFLGPGRYRVTLLNGDSVYVLWADGPNVDARGLFSNTATLQVRTLQNAVQKVRAPDLALSSAPVFVSITQ